MNVFHGQEITGYYPFGSSGSSNYSYFGSRKCLGDKANRYTYYDNGEPYCSSLPNGLSIDSSTGEISGTVNEAQGKAFKSWVFAEKIEAVPLTRSKVFFDAVGGSIMSVQVGFNGGESTTLKSYIRWARRINGAPLDKDDWRFINSPLVSNTLLSNVKDFLCFDYHREGKEYYDERKALIGLDPLVEYYSYYSGGIVSLGVDGVVRCIGFASADKVSNSIKLIDGLSGVKKIKKHDQFSIIVIMNSGEVKIFGGYSSEQSSGQESAGGGSYASCIAKKPDNCQCCWSVSNTNLWPWGEGQCRCPDKDVVWVSKPAASYTFKYTNYVYDKYKIMQPSLGIGSVVEALSVSSGAILAIGSSGLTASWGSESFILNDSFNTFKQALFGNASLSDAYRVKGDTLIGVTSNGKIITNNSELKLYAKCFEDQGITVIKSFQVDLNVVVLHLSNGYSLVYPSLSGYTGPYENSGKITPQCYIAMVENFKKEADINKTFSLPSISAGGIPPFLLNFKIFDIYTDEAGVALVCEGAGAQRYYRCTEVTDSDLDSLSDKLRLDFRVVPGPAKINPLVPFLETDSNQPSLEDGEPFELTLREISNPYYSSVGNWKITSAPSWINIETPTPDYRLGFSYADLNQVKIKGVAQGFSNQVINFTISSLGTGGSDYDLSFVIRNSKPKFNLPQGKNSYSFTGFYGQSVNASVSTLNPNETLSFRLLNEIPNGLSFDEQTGIFSGTFLCKLGTNGVLVEAVGNNGNSRTSVLFNVLPGNPLLSNGAWTAEAAFPSIFDLNTLIQNSQNSRVKTWELVSCDRSNTEYKIVINSETGMIYAIFYEVGDFNFNLKATSHSGDEFEVALAATADYSFPPVAGFSLDKNYELVLNSEFEELFNSSLPDHAVLSIDNLPLGLKSDSSKISGIPRVEGDDFACSYRIARKVLDIDVSDSGMVGSVLYGGVPLCWNLKNNDILASPPTVKSINSIVACSSGFLGLKEDGTLVAWSNIKLGTELNVPNLNDVIQIFGSGKSLVGALKSNGDIAYWTIGSTSVKLISANGHNHKKALFCGDYIIVLTDKGLRAFAIGSKPFCYNSYLSTEFDYIIYSEDLLDQYVDFSAGSSVIFATTNTGKIKGFVLRDRNNCLVPCVATFVVPQIMGKDIICSVGTKQSFLFSTIENYIIPYGDDSFLSQDLSLNSRPKKLCLQFETALNPKYLKNLQRTRKSGANNNSSSGFILSEDGNLIPINKAYVPDILFYTDLDTASFVVSPSASSAVPVGINNNQWLSISEDGSCIAMLGNIFSNGAKKNEISVFRLNSKNEWDSKKLDTSNNMSFNSSLSLNKDGTVISVGGNKP